MHVPFVWSIVIPISAPIERQLREDDMIDPKLLRAAKMLDAERRVPRPETLDEIELIDDD